MNPGNNQNDTKKIMAHLIWLAGSLACNLTMTLLAYSLRSTRRQSFQSVQIKRSRRLQYVLHKLFSGEETSLDDWDESREIPMTRPGKRLNKNPSLIRFWHITKGRFGPQKMVSDFCFFFLLTNWKVPTGLSGFRINGRVSAVGWEVVQPVLVIRDIIL